MKTEAGALAVRTGRPHHRTSEMQFMRFFSGAAAAFSGCIITRPGAKGAWKYCQQRLGLWRTDSLDTIFASLRSILRARQYSIGFYFDLHGAMTRA
jgi:hypothetical protein